MVHRIDPLTVIFAICLAGVVLCLGLLAWLAIDAVRMKRQNELPQGWKPVGGTVVQLDDWRKDKAASDGNR